VFVVSYSSECSLLSLGSEGADQLWKQFLNVPAWGPLYLVGSGGQSVLFGTPHFPATGLGL
jgi:hypothetical protein